ncbi:MAG: tRNA threonylcarbamoyladenosine dehydratase [Rhodocyclaceae bacterium]|nr:tRNA threonylcarbamoyladenosine dehydratase [Rhodocyclaceae bacterium]
MTHEMAPQRRFGGIERLYGEGSLMRLAAAHVCVVGLGGVGSWAAEALARSGVGALTLIDLDHVAESNINRQAHALESTLGMAKVEAMRRRIAEIHPQCRVFLVEDFITPENVAALVPPQSLVLDCIDAVRAKAALIAHCVRMGQTIVTTGGAGGKKDPLQIRCADLAATHGDPLCAKLRTALRRDHGFPRAPHAAFGVPCVFSPEALVRPNAACEIDDHPAGLHGLNCAGLGSAMTVTAAFGLAAAARALGILLASRDKRSTAP